MSAPGLSGLGQTLAGRQLGHTVEYHVRLNSTNERALAMGAAGAAHGSVVIAETQTAGRGRRGGRWQDAPGQGLLLSVVLRPGLDRARWPLLGLGAAWATAEAIQVTTGAEARTKWPNDVVIAGTGDSAQSYGKVAGVLVEAGKDFVVVGIGVNVKVAPAAEVGVGALPATCLAAHWQREVAREDLLVAFLDRLEIVLGQLEHAKSAELIARLCELDITLGMTVTFRVGGQPIQGMVEQIDPTGALVVLGPQGPLRIVAGEVSLSAAIRSNEVPDT